MAAKRKRPVESSQVGSGAVRKQSKLGSKENLGLMSNDKEGVSTGVDIWNIKEQAANPAEKAKSASSEHSLDQDEEVSSSGSEDDPDTSEMSSSLGDESSIITGTSDTPSENGEGVLDQDHHTRDAPPFMTSPTSAVDHGPDLRARILSFLPQLREANADLQNANDLPTRRLDEVGDQEERYIEMNLGLGVLTERKTTRSGTVLTKDPSPSDDDESDSNSIVSRNKTGRQDGALPCLTDLLGEAQGDVQKPDIIEVSG